MVIKRVAVIINTDTMVATTDKKAFTLNIKHDKQDLKMQGFPTEMQPFD